jgi:acyl-CoA dehydrogenase
VDFGFSEEQEMLRQSARALLEKECPSAVVRRLMEDERGFDPALWAKMAELGWLGLVIPEAFYLDNDVRRSYQASRHRRTAVGPAT